MIHHPLPYKLLIFDVDGTLRRTTTDFPCPNKPGEWEVLPNVKATLARYNSSTGIALATNQGGVALGYLSATMAAELCEVLLDDLLEDSEPYRSIYLCPHGLTDYCHCRKPSPWMLLLAVHDFNALRQDLVGLPQVLYVGDQPSDQEAARRAGIDFHWAHDFFNWPEPSPIYQPAW
jgi:histidinol-phosphate phosphatase family protein